MNKDVTQNFYFADPDRFADLVNGYAGYGKQLLLPQHLQSMDPRSGMYRMTDASEKDNSDYRRKNKKNKKQKMRYRDLKKKAALGINFLIVGIENQETIDYSIPVRIMSSDIGEYDHQVSNIRKQIRGMKSKNGLSPGEYLYGFRKNSRLFPVITFVIYYGEEEWDGARDLYSLLDLTDIPEELKRLIANYSINLIEVRKLKDTSVFKTDVRQVFDFIRYSNDKEKLRELVESNPAYRDLAEDAYDVIAQYVNAEELLEEKEKVKGKDGKVDMCKALKELIADGRAEGEARGIAIGETRMNELCIHLMNKNRYEDLRRATKDSKYRKKLFAEFNL